jgi:hypothetical protein
MTASRKASEVMSEPIDKRQPQRRPIVLNIKVTDEVCYEINQEKRLYPMILLFTAKRSTS